MCEGWAKKKEDPKMVIFENKTFSIAPKKKENPHATTDKGCGTHANKSTIERYNNKREKKGREIT